MPKFENHCQMAYDTFGYAYECVHEWLDEFAYGDGSKNPEHRTKRHHLLALEECRELFGDESVDVAKQHIIADCGGLPKDSVDCEDYEFRKWFNDNTD